MFPKEGESPPVAENDLRQMSLITEHLHSCIIRLKANRRVLNLLETFYATELLKDLEIYNRAEGWLNLAKIHVADFTRQLSVIILETNEVLHRADVLEKLAVNREGFVRFTVLIFAKCSSCLGEAGYSDLRYLDAKAPAK
jgi:hypothetical protein